MNSLQSWWHKGEPVLFYKKKIINLLCDYVGVKNNEALMPQNTGTMIKDRNLDLTLSYRFLFVFYYEKLEKLK